MIKRICGIVCTLLSLCFIECMAANNVESIDIDAVINDDGSVYITQVWKGEFYEGTENYIPINTDGIAISGLKVSDGNCEYSFDPYWNINASFEQKAGKCGINNTKDGIELCFGITRYGEMEYKIEYIIEDFIKAYNDYDGVNFMFINPDMSTFPTNGQIIISLANGKALNEDNARVWAFGYRGEVAFLNGKVLAYTSSALEGSNRMIVMLELDKGVIAPAESVNESFSIVKEEAFEGSDYTKDDTLLMIIIGVVMLIAVIIVIACMVSRIKRRRAIKRFYKEAGYFRDVPNGGNMAMSYYLAKAFDVIKDDSLIIGAMMLKMINVKALRCTLEKEVGFFGREKESVELEMMHQPAGAMERRLYSIIEKAAGSNGVLEEKELEKYARKNPESIESFINDCKYTGEAALIEKIGFNDVGNSIRNLTDSGKSELGEVIGLKKYLEDFSLIGERGIEESEIWTDYLVYATLFGIGDKVIKQLKDIYPEKIYEIEEYSRQVVVINSYSRRMYASHRAALQEKRASGGGGTASFGGGGGFSGGGSGGGSR